MMDDNHVIASSRLMVFTTLDALFSNGNSMGLGAMNGIVTRLVVGEWYYAGQKVVSISKLAADASDPARICEVRLANNTGFIMLSNTVVLG